MDEQPAEKQDDRFVEPATVAPLSDQTKPDAGAKMFVLFFFLLIPPLGVAIVAAVCWHLYRLMTAG